MTSGNFSSYPIESIFVDRAERQRREISPDAIANLASSIAKTGLINPVTIERNGRLRAGETRWLACKSLGWTSIPVQFIDDLPEAELQLIELDENIKRTNLSWQEECEAVARYHRLKQETEGEAWTQAATADALGFDPAAVAQRLTIHQELKKPESRVHNATKFSEARNIVSRIQSRAAASAIESILAPKEERHVPLIHSDFTLWAKQYDGPKFNFIHCDFPYGINADGQQQGSNVAVMGAYDDSPDVYFSLLDTLRGGMENVVAESAHLIFWFSMRFYCETRDRLSEMGWKVDPFPLIWHKSDNVGLLPDPQRGGRRTYETAFFASRGDRKIVQAVAQSVSLPTTKKIHMSEKPLAVLNHFFRMVVDEYSLVLDPTCGSGNALRQATRMGAASALGIERDPEFFKLATQHFFDED